MAVTLFVLLIIVLFTNHEADGTLRFASYYGDHMVLQKSPERAVIWGYGPEGAQVILFMIGPTNQKASPVNVTKGIWKVTLDPVEAGGPYNVTAAIENNTATLTDVLFGDVWLCGGQSNMYFNVSQIFNASEELAIAAKYPHVRTFMASLRTSTTELTDLLKVELPWAVPTKESVAPFSAVCWLFGRYMYKYLNHPIGLVESCWGGTPVEVWSSLRALKHCGLEKSVDGPKGNSVLWNAMIHPLLNMTIKGAIWYQGEANTYYHQDTYNCSFPAMIDDWRMSFHQGSGGQTAPDFPFGFVQLSTDKKGSTDDGFPEVRWHQTADIGFVPNARMKRTFMAVALDLPDETSPYSRVPVRLQGPLYYYTEVLAPQIFWAPSHIPRRNFPRRNFTTVTPVIFDHTHSSELFLNETHRLDQLLRKFSQFTMIHPRDKQDVAYRLTLGARAVAYDEQNVPFLGPFPQQILSGETYINITYDQAVSVTPSKYIFEICCSETQDPCGPKSKWVQAPIMLWSPTTVQLSPKVCPVTDVVAALRYAWSDWPCDFKACPIYSASGVLPAPPFLINRHPGKETIWISD